MAHEQVTLEEIIAAFVEAVSDYRWDAANGWARLAFARRDGALR